MMNAPPGKNATLVEVSQALGLEYDPVSQDWGIENADPDRLKEFALMLPVNRDVATQLLDLGLESVNDRLLKGGTLPPVLAWEFRRIRLSALIRDRLVYWQRRDGSRDFPVTDDLAEVSGLSDEGSEP